MSKYPKLKGNAAEVPLSYNPLTNEFIYYKDVVSGKEKIVLIAKLNDIQKRKLVAARLKAQPDTTFADLNGNILSKDQLLEAIENDTAPGKFYYESDLSYLNDFIKEFE